MADFNPKFVDLVRNYSTTTGTQDFVLGPAVNGFTGFAAACAAGERFYYACIGVDKPAEREIGRGTLLANGKIGREPVGGAARTNFTGGTKAIGLVAAAELYGNFQQSIAELQDQIGSIGGGGAPSAATRAELAAINPSSAAFVMLREAGREGLFLWDGANHAALAAADTRQGLTVAPQGGNGSSGAWVRKYSGGADFRWFGAIADCSAAGAGTSNTAAFDAACAALIAAGRPHLHIPAQPAAYRFATAPAQIHDHLAISGDGWSYNPGIVGGITYTGVQAYGGTVLCFDEDVAGFEFVGFTDNDAAATVTEFKSGVGSSVRDLMLHSAGGTGTAAHGIERRIVVHLDNVRIEGFAGHGLVTIGNSAGALPWGSVDCSVARAVSCRFNKLSGFFTTGDDANVNHFDTCDAALNGGTGFLDKAMLGNTYTACHAATNNQSFGTPAGYSAAQRTQNTADWAGLADQYAGSFVTTSGVAAHKFDGCYVEIGEGRKHEIVYPAIISGGYLASTDRTAAAAASPARIDNAGAASGIDTINTRASGLTVTDRIIANPASGNAIVKAQGSGAYAGLQLYPGDSGAMGLDILAGLGGAYLSADTFTARNAAQGAIFLTIASSGTLVKSGALGYGTGAGGAATQTTSKSTGVMLNKACGQITLHNEALAPGAAVSFTLTNSMIDAADLPLVAIASGASANSYSLEVTAVASGSCRVQLTNVSPASLSEAAVLNFSLIKGVSA